MSLHYPPRVELACTPTPLHLLERFSSELGGPRIWVKRDDLTGFGLSGNKVRKLEFCIADALDQGCDTLLTCGGVQSNHCRATAVAARQLGLDVHLVLRTDEAPTRDGNLFIDQLLGANISYVSKAEYAAGMGPVYRDLIADYSSRGRKVYAMPVGASDEVGLWGYIAATEELAGDFARQGINPAHIVCATGSGGTQGGLTLGVKLLGLGARVWGVAVCDDADYFEHKIRADIQAWRSRYPTNASADAGISASDLAIDTIDGYVGPGYARATNDVFDLIGHLARVEGLLLDPIYTGKAFHGMVEEIRSGRRFGGAEDIVFIHTGGFFASYAQRQQFDLSDSPATA